MILHLTENSPEPMRIQIARQVRAKILAGDLEETGVLPECHRIARESRVSPRDVQHAMTALVEEGLLEPASDERFRVANLAPRRRRALAERRLIEDPAERGLLERELEVAREIQRRLLPPARVDGERFSIVSRSFPARFVSGDFHDVLRSPDGSIGVVVADVVGKGLGASLIMASVKAMTPFVAQGRSVAETLSELNRQLCGELGRGRFVALAFARFRPATGTVELANAGMPDPFVVSPVRVPEALEVSGPRLPLGIRPDVVYESVTRTLSAGERLLLFSDGIPEARVASGGALGYDGLAGILGRARCGTSDPGRWLDAVLDEAQRSSAPVPEDDWTAVAVELRPEGPG